jgi:hypothetical protein
MDYVENWLLLADLISLGRTGKAVLRASDAWSSERCTLAPLGDRKLASRGFVRESSYTYKRSMESSSVTVDISRLPSLPIRPARREGPVFFRQRLHPVERVSTSWWLVSAPTLRTVCRTPT